MGNKRGVKFTNSGQFSSTNQRGRYTGGAVKGHLPTSPHGNPASLPAASAAAFPWRFDQPLGRMNSGKGRPFSRERRCMEEIQNGRLEAELLTRYPPRMVARLTILADLAEDVTHRDCLKAQQLIREVLETKRGIPGVDNAELQPKVEGVTVQVLRTGKIDVPLPGTADPVAPAAAPGE